VKIDLPEISSVMPLILDVESSFMGSTMTIRKWVREHRKAIKANLSLVNNPSDKNDIEILLSFLRDLLVRAMKGEAGERTYQELKLAIKDKSKLRYVVYESDNLHWNWKTYLKAAQDNKDNNFASDHLLTIKDIGYKVRDLALSSFDPSFAAFDLHVARVPTRIGLLNYGYDLLNDPNIEMGNNPNNIKNYLFLHKLFLKLSSLVKPKFTPAELDRAFWHFGRTLCRSKPQCRDCPINVECLTGKYLIANINKEKRTTLNRSYVHHPVTTEHIKLPYGGPDSYFDLKDLLKYVAGSGRDYIIIGGINCTFANHKKPQSLDYWLRSHYTNRKDTRQAVTDVINQLCKSGRFKLEKRLVCPDSDRPCKGLRLNTNTNIESNL
jgi:hypothetical protein